MENLLVNVETKKKTTSFRLLPRYFKVIGIVLIGLAIGIVVLKASLDIELIASHKKWNEILVMDLLILGLLLISLSKDRVEDEMTMIIRLNSIAGTFVFSVIYTVVMPITSSLLNRIDYFKGATTELTASGLVFTMLLVYLQFYYFQKRSR